MTYHVFQGGVRIATLARIINKRLDPGVILQVQFRFALALQCLETNFNVAAVAGVETDLQAIVVVALIFKSRALRVGVVEVLVADLGEVAVVVLQTLRYSCEQALLIKCSHEHRLMFPSHGPGEYPEPDVQVRKIENETARAVQLKSTGPQKSILQPRLPPRPGYGTQGKEVTLWANYFEIAAHKDLLLFRYSIEIIPVDSGVGRVPTGKRAKRVIELLVEEHFSEHKNSIATDYKSNLICRSELPIDEEGYLVRYRLEDEDEPSQNAKAYRLRLQSTGTLAVSELMDYLTSSHASNLLGSKEEIIQALNIVIGQYPKSASKIFSVGANKHFELAPAAFETMSLGGGLQAIRGFFISVRSATCCILLNVQVKHAACYEEGLLGSLISTYLGNNDRNIVRLATF